MLIQLPDEIAQRLEQIAQQEKTTVSDLLQEWMNRYLPQQSYATLADLAQNALEANLASQHPINTAENEEF